MPTEVNKPSATRRAFLSGRYFSREGRERLVAEQAASGLSAPGSIRLDTAACLAWQGIACVSCRYACPESAIEWRDGTRPSLDSTACTDCGACAPGCPVGAIRIAVLGCGSA